MQAGYAVPGQTVDELFESFHLGMLLTFTWQWVRQDRTKEDLQKLDDAYEQAVDPKALKKRRAKKNLEILGQSKKK